MASFPFVSLYVCFVFLYVCVVYVCLICENPGIDVVLTRTVSLLWSVGDRLRRVAVRRSLSIQGHTCKAPCNSSLLKTFGVHVRTSIVQVHVYRYRYGRDLPHANHLLLLQAVLCDAHDGVVVVFCGAYRWDFIR